MPLFEVSYVKERRHCAEIDIEAENWQEAREIASNMDYNILPWEECRSVQYVDDLTVSPREIERQQINQWSV